MATRTQVFDELHRTAFAFLLWRHPRPRILVHCQGVQGNIRAAPGVWSRRQVVSIDFARHFENAYGNAFRHFRAAGEPFAIGPALQDLLGVLVTLVGLLLDIMELVEHQQRLLQTGRGHAGNFGVIQQLNQRADVVTTQHGAQQFGGIGPTDQRAFLAAVRHSREVTRFDLGGVIHTRRHPVADEFQQKLPFAIQRAAGIFQQLNKIRSLAG